MKRRTDRRSHCAASTGGVLVALMTVLHPSGIVAEESRLDVTPRRILLDARRAGVQLVITARDAGGQPRDVTHEVRFQSDPGGLVEVSGGRVRPGSQQTEGVGRLHVSWQGQVATVPVQVSGQGRPDPIRFTYEMLAALTKQGCNAGSCHGSPDGKGGFSLSLFAFDPAHDTESLVRGGLVRRLNVLSPLESLLLKKPMLRVPHVGGKRLKPTDAAFGIMRNWIAEGARPDSAGAARCDRITVSPGPSRILARPHWTQQLAVVAHFSDGSTRDVTPLATYDTSHRDIATIDADGRVRGTARGQAAITVRYLEHLESVYFTLIEDVEGFEWPEVPEHNVVDQLVNNRLKLLQVAPSGTCEDGVFLRRVMLDLTGLLPSPDEARRFLADRSADKRTRLIDRLLATDQFARFQALQMSDLLQINPKRLGADRAELFVEWIVQAMRENRPFDQVTREMLTATGDTRIVAPANYFATISKTEDLAEATAQVFMGARIGCAKCHNHPFEKWTQDDYYSIGAAFHRVSRTESRIGVAGAGEMRNPRSGKVMTPWGQDRVKPAPLAGADRRVAFSSWLTSPGNPYFARAAVNRIWAHLFGRGLVDPVDDFRSSNPPSHVTLLDRLSDEFVKSRFDRRHVIRLICTSQTYQRSTVTNRFNKDDQLLCSHAAVRLLTAEQLRDAIGLVTGAIRTVTESGQVVADALAARRRVRKELADGRKKWEQQHRDQLAAAAFWDGGWYSSRRFPGKNPEETFRKDFGPEAHAGRPLREQVTTDPETQWHPRFDWNHEEQINLGKTGVEVLYAVHTVHANRDVDVRLPLVADDGLKVWHNGKVVFESPQVLSDDPEGKKIIHLVKGPNVFLVKSFNKGGAWHFTWRVQPVEPDTPRGPGGRELPDGLAEILVQPRGQRGAEAESQLNRFYLHRDGRLKKLQRQIDTGARDQYATQRPFPQRDDFLQAFGQPERKTPCACERSSEPTLDQALQLLNGRRVHDQVQASVKRFATLPDDKLVEELYLLAFSRYPQQVERVAATEHLAGATDRAGAVRDLVWAVLNTQEFIFQH